MLVLATLLAQSQSAPINPRFYAFSSYIGPVVNLTFDDPAVLRVVSNDSRQRRENTNTWCCVVCSHPDQFRKFRPFSYDIYLPFFVLQTAPLRSTSKLIHLSIFFLSWEGENTWCRQFEIPWRINHLVLELQQRPMD